MSESGPRVYPLFDPSLTDWDNHVDEIDWSVVPAHIGPTWDKNPDWDGPRDPDGYILPKLTLGWHVINWLGKNIVSDDTDDRGNRLPFRFTNEQLRVLLWMYEIDEAGKLVTNEYTLTRLKGWGKDPVAAFMAAAEFVGPCRFAGWASRDMPEIGVRMGDPVGKEHQRAWVQVAAVNLAQSQNTMMLFRGMFTDECIAEHGIEIGREVIYAHGGQRKIQALTSSPRALEGARPTAIILNEVHQWVRSNQGIAMYDVIERNAAKANGGGARLFAITNAHNPSEESVGRMIRDAYEMRASGVAIAGGVIYDTLEAPPDAKLRPQFPDELQGADISLSISPETKTILTKRYLRRVLEQVRGGAVWLDIDSLIKSIVNPNNSASRSRRFWYNAPQTSEDAWVHPDAVQAAIDPDVRALRRTTHDPKLALEAGWTPVRKDEPIVAFFDGSKTDDSTAIVGCRVSDGYTFLIGLWAKSELKRNRDREWLAPRAEVDMRVDEMFDRFNVVAFWGDPSHAKTDDIGESESSYWMPYLDRWMQRYSDRLDPNHYPVKMGLKRHAVNFDMAVSTNLKSFIAAAEQTVEDFENLNDVEDFEPTFKIDGHPGLVSHLTNAVRYADQRGWGISLTKDQKDSPRKIDAAICLVGARMLRRAVLNNERAEEPKGKAAGEVWF